MRVEWSLIYGCGMGDPTTEETVTVEEFITREENCGREMFFPVGRREVNCGPGSDAAASDEMGSQRTPGEECSMTHMRGHGFYSPPGGSDVQSTRCVALALEAATSLNFDELIGWVPWRDIKSAVYKRPTIRLLKVAQWRWPSTEIEQLLVTKGGGFSADAIATLCKYAPHDFSGIFQVHLIDTDHSGHCIAIVDRTLFDPHDLRRRPLSPASFAELNIGQIINGFMIVQTGGKAVTGVDLFY